PETQALDRPAVREEGVGRRAAAMHAAGAVRVREALADRTRDLDRARERHPSRRVHPRVEVASDAVLHRKERLAVLLAEVVDRDDVRMRQLRRRPRLAKEALALLGLAVELA